MNERNIISAVLLGTLLCVGLATMGLLLSEGIIKFRDMERVVSYFAEMGVKGFKVDLAEGRS